VSRRFRVVTDSTSDVPPAWRERFGIEVVPLTVVFGNESFRDRVDLSHDEFFSRLRGASKLPTTSAPAPGDFATVYERLSRECDGVISIHLGGNLSGTVDSARLGAQAVDGFPVHVVDSRSVTMCVGFLCRLAAESTSLEEAVQRVEERVPRLRILALLDTLRYLEMGGRVTHAQALVGTVLDVKPIMGVAEGRIDVRRDCNIRRLLARDGHRVTVLEASLEYEDRVRGESAHVADDRPLAWRAHL